MAERGDSRLRQTTKSEKGSPCPEGGTAYLMILKAIDSKDRLVHGTLHRDGESCAIGSFWDVNPKCSLPTTVIDEVAMVNDSVPNATGRQRKLTVQRWLKWRLRQLGMPGYERASLRPTR